MKAENFENFLFVNEYEDLKIASYKKECIESTK